MSIWFTSDLHLGHANIIRYCNRPFAHADEMDEALISNWNSKVQPDDEVYVLGDVALCPATKAVNYLRRMHGTKFLVEGNHDRGCLKDPAFRNQFSWIRALAELDVPDPTAKKGGRKIVMCHYAMRVWNKSHHGAIQLYGHSHGSLPDDPNALSMDVGVDNHNYTPISLEDVMRFMSKKKWRAVDHHGYREE